MASFADAIGILTGTQLIQTVIPFLLVYLITYGILSTIKKFENKELNASIAFVLALAVVISPMARVFITAVTGPMATFAVVIFLFMIVLFSTGLSVKDISTIVGFDRDEFNPMWTLFVVIGVIIILASVASSFPDAIGSNVDLINQKAAQMNMSVNSYVNTLPVGQRIIFFLSLPQVLGLVVLIIIFAIGGFLLIPPDAKK